MHLKIPKDKNKERRSLYNLSFIQLIVEKQWMARNKYSSQFKTKFIEDWKPGLSRHELSKQYSINRSVISRLIPKFLQTGRILRGHSGGGPLKTTRYDDSLVKRPRQKDPTASANQVRTSLRLCVSERTIRRRAVEALLFSR